MLVARLRPENPRGAARLAYEDQGTRFILEGVGEITAAKLLDLENRQQLVWVVDEATRERVRGAAIARVRRDTASRAGAHARAAAAPLAARHDVGGRPPAIPAAPPRSGAPDEAAQRSRRGVSAQPPAAESRRRQTTGRATRTRRRWAWAIVALACAAAVALGLLYFGQIADRLATSPAAQGTHYTALYFTDPAPLSATLSVREPSQLSFTVFNHEGRQRVYQYVVTLAGPQGSSVVQRGSISLKEDTGAVTVVNLGPTGRHGAYLITVTITDPPQSIHTEGYL